jgi:hypothetical protein
LEPQQQDSQSSPAASWLLLAAAILLYIPWLLALYGAPSWVEPGGGGGEDRISEAYATLWVLALGIPLWLALGGLLLLGWRKGFAPPAWAATSGIVYAAAAIATLSSAQTYMTWPGGWSLLVPALLPPLLAFYGIAVRMPVLAAGSLHVAPLAALGGAVLVALAAIPLAFIDPAGYPVRLAQHQAFMNAVFAKRDAQAQDAALQWEAGIKKLGRDSSLASWLEYVNGSVDTEPLHQQALDGARSANSRQADAVELLNNGQIQKLEVLWQLDLAVTPDLCAAYDKALTQLATTDDPYETEVGEQLERQLPNIKFFVAGHCNLPSSLGATATRLGKVAEVNPGDQHWAQLRATLTNLH